MNLPNLKLRSQVVKDIRAWFDARDFLEVQTSRLVGLPGQEPYLEPFWTMVETPTNIDGASQQGMAKRPAGLITSPEYMCKRLLAAGIPRLYDLGPCFRNAEPWDGTHDPEFLLLEWYRRDAGLEELMQDTENLMRDVAEQASRRSSSAFRFDQPFRRLTVEQAWKQYTGIDLAPLLGNREALAQLCQARGQSVTESDTWDDLYFKIFLAEIEPKLGWNEGKPCPTFLYRYPASQAALARRSQDHAEWADRVEVYVGNPASGESLELANGFAELSDEAEQRQRFEEERALRAGLGKPTWALDEAFLASLPAMGNAAGIAFGVDRLVMLFAGTASINDILPASARERFSPQDENQED